jgi:hypothetical protein
MTVLSVLLFVAAGFFALRMHSLDRRMQAFRSPDASPSAFTLVPIRWRQELYLPNGQTLVTKAWGAFGASAACFFGGAILFLITAAIKAAT